jgi:integrase
MKKSAGHAKFRAKVRHPLDASRVLRVSGDTRAELEGRRSFLVNLRKNVRTGAISHDAAARMLAGVDGSPKVAELVDAYAKTLNAPNTLRRIETLRRTLFAPLLDREAIALDQTILAQWIAELRKQGYADTTIGTGWRALSTAMRLALGRSLHALPWGDWRPRLRDEPKPRDSARTPAELAALLDVAEAWDVRQRSKNRIAFAHAIVSAVACLGLRQGETMALAWTDFGADLLTVTIARTWTPGGKIDKDGRPAEPEKGRAPGGATLAVHPELAQVLDDHRDYLLAHRRYREDGPVFPRYYPSGGKWRQSYPIDSSDSDGDNTAVPLRTFVELAGLDPTHWTATSLRDTHTLLELQANGGDLRAAMARTRHRSVSSFAHYVRTLRPSALVPAGFGPGPRRPSLAEQKGEGPRLPSRGPSVETVPDEDLESESHCLS